MDPLPDPSRIPTDSAAVCLGCGYPLSGLDPASNCPECGRPVALSRPIPDLAAYPDALPPVDPAALPLIDGMWPCARCGFGLHNLRLDAFCPSCGYPVAASVPDRAGYQTPRGVTCIMCKYALESLDHRGNCPECNFSIARSRRGDLLLDSPPRHLARLILGARLLIWASILPLFILAFFIAALFGAVGGSSIAGNTMGVLFVASVVVTYILFFTGWLFLTDRDLGSFTPGVESMRIAARIGIIVTAVFLGGALILSYLSRYAFSFGASTGAYGTGAVFGILMIILQIGALLAVPIALATMILSMIYLRRWSQRIPDMFIFKRARFMMWAWPGLFALNFVLVCGGFALVFGAMSGGMGGTFLIILPYVFFLGSLLAFLIIHAHLFNRVTRALATVRAAQRAATPPAAV